MLITRSLQLFNPFSSDCSLIYFCTYDGACLLESSDHQYRCSKRVARLCSTVPPALKHDMIGVSYTIKLVSYSFKRLAHASFNLKLGLKGFKKQKNWFWDFTYERAFFSPALLTLKGVLLIILIVYMQVGWSANLKTDYMTGLGEKIFTWSKQKWTSQVGLS